MPFVINTCTIKINIFIASTNFQWRFRSASKVSKPASMGVIPGISEDRRLRFLKYADRRCDTLNYEEAKTQEYQTNKD